MNRINKLALGVVTTLALLIPSLAQAQVISTAPQTFWQETDVALPLGMWHVQVRADKFYIEKNTAANGGFGTTTVVISATGTTLAVPTLNMVLGATPTFSTMTAGSVLFAG